MLAQRYPDNVVAADRKMIGQGSFKPPSGERPNKLGPPAFRWEAVCPQTSFCTYQETTPRHPGRRKSHPLEHLCRLSLLHERFTLRASVSQKGGNLL